MKTLLLCVLANFILPGQGKDGVGVKIKNDAGGIYMGEKADVSLFRMGDSKLGVAANVDVQGSVSAKGLTVDGTTVFARGITQKGNIWGGSIRTPKQKWYPMVRIKKAKDDGYNVHQFTMKVSSSENSGFDVFHMHGFWIDRSDHDSGHGDFSGFAVSNAGTAGDCTHTHSCDVAFMMSNCGVTNGDMYILASKVEHDSGRGLQVLELFYNKEAGDIWEFDPFKSVDAIPDGCLNLAAPTQRSGLPNTPATATYSGLTTDSLTVTGTTTLKGPIWREGTIWGGSIRTSQQVWYPMVRMSKKKDGGYNVHSFVMTVSATENSGFDLFNMHGFWIDRSDHDSGHGDFSGFSVANAGAAGDCTHTHSCDVAFMMSNCGVTNGDMYILASKVAYDTGRSLAVLDLYFPGGKNSIWEFDPFKSVDDIPDGCKGLAAPTERSGVKRRLQQQDSVAAEDKMATLMANQKAAHAKVTKLEEKIARLEKLLERSLSP